MKHYLIGAGFAVVGTIAIIIGIYINNARLGIGGFALVLIGATIFFPDWQ